MLACMKVILPSVASVCGAVLAEGGETQGPMYSVNTGIPCRGVNGMPSFFKLPVVSPSYCGCIFEITEKADFNMGLFFRNRDYTIWLTGMPKWDVHPIVMEYFKTASCPWWTSLIHKMKRVWSHFLSVKSHTSWIPVLRAFSTYDSFEFHWSCYDSLARRKWTLSNCLVMKD